MATPIQQVMQVCHATPQETAAFEVTERLDTMEDYAELTSRDIKSIADKLEKRTAQNGRVLMSAKTIKNVQAFCFWARERTRQQIPLQVADFMANTLSDAKAEMRERDEGKPETPSIKPEKFKGSKWKAWAKQFVTYLSHIDGAVSKPIDYVVRTEPRPAGPPNARMDEVYLLPLQGRAFREDNMLVYRLLSDLVSGTAAETWISNFDATQNGRAAWTALKAHYEGGGEQEKTVMNAEATISALHYKNESVFTFEEFSSKLIECYKDLEDAGRPETEYNKVKKLLEKIQINHPRVEVVKQRVRDDHKENFPAAVTYMSTQFSEMFPQVTIGKRNARNISGVDAKRGRYGDDSPTGADALPETNADGTITIYGVNVTNVGRTFSQTEMDQLGHGGRSYIFRERNRLGLNSDRARGPGRGRGRGRGRSGYGGYGYGDKRHLAPLASDRDDVSAMTGTQEQASQQLPPPPTGVTPPTGGGSSGGSTCGGVGGSSGGSTRGSNNGNRFGAGSQV